VTAILDAGIDELAPIVGRKRACEVLGRSRAGHYREKHGPRHGPPKPRRSPRALTAIEAETVVTTLNEERFCDKAPAQVWATLLDEGTYLASVSTMYRLLRLRGSCCRELLVSERLSTVVVSGGLTLVTTDRGVFALTCRPPGDGDTTRRRPDGQ
jgi:hypothetical protein